MNKFNRKTWVKVPDSDSVPVSPCPKHRIDDASLLKEKWGGGLIEMSRKGTSSCQRQLPQKGLECENTKHSQGYQLVHA